ncbi:unnamed protein product [Prunus brigantina]
MGTAAAELSSKPNDHDHSLQGRVTRGKAHHLYFKTTDPFQCLMVTRLQILLCRLSTKIGLHCNSRCSGTGSKNAFSSSYISVACGELET